MSFGLSALKAAVKSILLFTRAYRLAAMALNDPRTSIRILSYHKVCPEWDPFFPGVPISMFRRQMAYLKKNYRILPLGEVLEKRRKGSLLPPNTVCITFDDGYRCVHDSAMPVLREMNIPATVFLTTGMIGTTNTIWTDRVSMLLKHFEDDAIFFRNKALPAHTRDERIRAMEEIKESMKKMDDREKKAALDKMYEEAEPAPGLPETEYPFMDWEMVKQMSKEGIGFGSHTVTHPILSRLPVEAQQKELSDSGRKIEEMIGKQVELFAYPNGMPGDYDRQTIDLLEKTGYSHAFLNHGGVWKAHHDRPYEIPRISENHLFPAFIWKAAGLER